jgi:hypothetical protein
MINFMPKVNHARNFKDLRDYRVPPGDWVCGKHGVANNRRGVKKGVNRANRTRERDLLHKSLSNENIDPMLKIFKEIRPGHDYNGKTSGCSSLK